MALALGSASRSRADRFPEGQTAPVADQRHHLHEQLKQIHLDIFEKWPGTALRIATLIVGPAAAAGLDLTPSEKSELARVSSRPI
jgi:hypothetical protein